MNLTAPSTSNYNVPNALSAARLVLAIVVCVLIELRCFFPALICFVIAASTDFLDGWWARKYNQITKLGRILDPFVDKTIICGAMIALVGIPESGIVAWMAILVTCRELLVTSLRGLVEGSGGDFSAKQLGKWKMAAQCAAIVTVLLCLMQGSPPAGWIWARWLSIWAAVILTVLSGLEYVMLVVRSNTPTP
ncbi:MAG: CDP-diacylglycerol--glycerol-3-phosphate 3-phosphatidyltransferase [Pirellulaceae bacterium]|nr:CDP-diacylglycerol--glycerol-3-phosphate 3-phosphatidyltransferase [Pirellulaceae bacterium]